MLPRLRSPFNRERDAFSAPRLKSLIEQLRENRYQALANSTATAVYCCDAAGVITYYNDQATNLWGRKPVRGDTDQRFCASHMLYRMDGSFMPHDECPMAEVLSGKVSGIYDAVVQIERPDGSRVVVTVNIAPLISEAGAIVGAVNSFCEDSERRRAKK